MDRLYVRIRWWARAGDSAVHYIWSPPELPPYQRPNLYDATHIDAHSYMEDRITDVCVPHGRAWLGSQAFRYATAFNANIGAWNAASVSNMYYVCAASGRRRTTAGAWDALGRSSMRR